MLTLYIVLYIVLKSYVFRMAMKANGECESPTSERAKRNILYY